MHGRVRSAMRSRKRRAGGGTAALQGDSMTFALQPVHALIVAVAAAALVAAVEATK